MTSLHSVLNRVWILLKVYQIIELYLAKVVKFYVKIGNEILYKIVYEILYKWE